MLPMNVSLFAHLGQYFAKGKFASHKEAKMVANKF